jgi:hypothetical protein
MAKIPAFSLPSEPATLIQFRAPTVSDSLDFCGLRKDLEEKAATEYLRQLQDAPVSDPELWTAQDRRTALWWIFMSITDDTSLSYSYECAHCGDTHHVDVDLVELDDQMIVLDVPPYITGEILVGGEPMAARFHPLDGRAVTHLEEMRLALADADEVQTARIRAEIKVLETVHAFTLDAHQGMSWQEALAAKTALVMAMEREREYTPLVAQCLLAAEELRHGLATEIRDGEVFVLSPPLPCESDKFKEGAPELRPATVLEMRFRGQHFIPAV